MSIPVPKQVMPIDIMSHQTLSSLVRGHDKVLTDQNNLGHRLAVVRHEGSETCSMLVKWCSMAATYVYHEGSCILITAGGMKGVSTSQRSIYSSLDRLRTFRRGLLNVFNASIERRCPELSSGTHMIASITSSPAPSVPADGPLYL